MTNQITQADVDESLAGLKALALEAAETHGSMAVFETDIRPALQSQGLTVPTLSELLGVDITITER